MVNLKNLTFLSKDLKNFFWRSLQLFSRQGILLALFATSALYLGVYDLGRLSYALSIISIFAIFSDFGISTAVSKFTTEYFHSNKTSIKEIFGSSIFTILLISSVLGISMLFFGKILFSDSLRAVWYLFPLTILIPLVSVYDGIFRGLSDFKRISIMTTGAGLASFLGGICLIHQFGFEGALAAQVLFYLLNVLILIPLFKYHSLRFSKKVLVKVVKYSGVIGLTNISYFILTRIPIIALGNSGNFELAAYFDISTRIMMIFLNIAAAYAVVLAPDIINRYALGITGLKLEISKYLKTTLCLGVFGSLVIAAVAALLSALLFKQYLNYEFFTIFLLFVALMPSYVIEAFFANAFITPLGQAKLLLFPTAVGVVLLIAAAFFQIFLGPWIVVFSYFAINLAVNVSKILLFFRFSQKV